MAHRAAGYWRTMLQQNSRAFSTATNPNTSKPQWLKAEYGPIYILAGFLTIVMSLACHNGWQQLVHSPSVVVTKKKRESIHEIEEPSQANTAGGRLVDNSFLRKVAHIQDDSKSTMPRNLKDSIYTREANMAADWLFKSGHLHQIGSTRPGSLPRELQKIIWEDMTGRTFVRKAA